MEAQKSTFTCRQCGQEIFNPVEINRILADDGTQWLSSPIQQLREHLSQSEGENR